MRFVRIRINTRAVAVVPVQRQVSVGCFTNNRQTLAARQSDMLQIALYDRYKAYSGLTVLLSALAGSSTASVSSAEASMLRLCTRVYCKQTLSQ